MALPPRDQEPVATGSRGDGISGAKPKKRAVKAPAGDIASSGGDYGTTQAKRAARTPKVRRAVRAVYEDQPIAQRQRILRNAKGPVAKTVHDVHEQRRQRAEDLEQARAQHDILTAGDAKRAAAFNAAHPVTVKRHGGGLFATILGTADQALAGKLTEGATHAAETAAAKAAPIAAIALDASAGIPLAAGHLATAKLTGADKPLSRLASNAAKDIVDLPANAVPSLYLPARRAAGGDVKGAAGMLAQPFVETAKHPLRSLMEHPVGTALLVRGGEGALGHGAGRVLRAAPSETLRRIGSTERAAKTVPGARVAQNRSYSKDVIEKGAQVVHERRQARRAVRAGGPAPTVMTDREIARRVSEEHQAAKLIGGQHAAQTEQAARRAVGKKPTAATTLAAQGITNATHADLHAYAIELERQARSLTGDELAANERTQKLIHQALEHHDEQRVSDAAQRYSEHAAGLEAQVLQRGLVKPETAEATRLAPIAVRRLGASSEAKRGARATAKEQRTQAERGARRAGKQMTAAEQGMQRARANARVSVASRRRSPQLAIAEKQRRVAVADLARLKRQQRGRPYTMEAAAEMKGARDLARQADRAVIAERARIRGVAPAEHQQLLRAIAVKDEARTALNEARGGAKAATAAHRAIKKAPFVNQRGEPVDVADVRAAMPRSMPEPAFVSHAPGGARVGALPVDRPTIAVKANRGGEAVIHGTLPVHPEELVQQSVRTQRLIDAADARDRFLEDFGYRAGHDAVEAYSTQQIAERIARDAQAKTGVRWSPMQRADKHWVLVPKAAKARLAEHEQATTVHPVLKAVSAQWRRNVLGFSPKWLTGNTLEAALRSTVAGAGPRSYVTARRAISQLDRTDPGAAGQLRARALGGGQYRTAQRVANEPVGAGGQELGAFARAAAKLRRTHGPKELADLYGHYTHLVFSSLNGRIETQFQTAMLGKALRDSPLMSHRTVKLSAAAAEDAARGLRDTNAQVALGREVDRMYGQYQKFSPGLRNAISTYTPFIAWTINAANFLTRVLPHDHPVLTSLIASANQASEDWRKDNKLWADLLHSSGLPGWLQGSIPGAAGSHLRVSRYTPFGLVDNEGNNPIGGLPSLLLPQFSEVMKNLEGENWQGRSLTKTGEPTGARDLIAAAASFIEGQVPAAAQALNIAGARTPNMADSTKIKPGVAVRARSQFDPFMYTQANTPAAPAGGVTVKVAPIKVAPVKVKPVRVR